MMQGHGQLAWCAGFIFGVMTVIFVAFATGGDDDDLV